MDKIYATDVTDEQWALVEPLIPPAIHGGAPRTVNMRLVFIIDEAGVFVDLTLQSSESDAYQGIQHQEPQWACVKSMCREGGLIAFNELTKSHSPDGSPGSPGSLTTQKVTAPSDPTQNQAFHQNGSVGSRTYALTD